MESPESQTFIQDKQVMEAASNEQAEMVCTCKLSYTLEHANFKREKWQGSIQNFGIGGRGPQTRVVA